MKAKHSGLLRASKPPPGGFLRPKDCQDLPLGHENFGRTQISCGIGKDGLHLGYLKDNDPAASIKLDLGYVGNAVYKIETASFRLTVVPVVEGQDTPTVTEHVFPQERAGPVTLRTERSEFHVKPEISVPGSGGGFGGMGYIGSKEEERKSQWQFNGGRRQGKNGEWQAAQWDWCAGEFTKRRELGMPKSCALVLRNTQCEFGTELRITASVRKGRWRILKFTRNRNTRYFDWSNEEDYDVADFEKHIALLAKEIDDANRGSPYCKPPLPSIRYVY